MISPSLEHCIWLEEKQIAFVYIPKVACTSWKLFIWKLQRGSVPNNISYKNIHKESNHTLPYVGRMNKKKQDTFLKKIREGEIKLCGVIREPRERVLSAYLDKILLHENINSYFSKEIIPRIRAHNNLEITERPTFREFLAWNNHIQKNEKLNEHWKPQAEILGINNEKDQKQNNINLWTMENMQIASEWIKKHFESTEKFPQKDELGPRKTNNSKELIQKYYDNSAVAEFDKLYWNDMNLYTYAKNKCEETRNV